MIIRKDTIDEGFYLSIPREIITSKMSDGAVVLYGLIYCHEYNREEQVSEKELAEELNISIATFRRRKKELVDFGAIA